MHDAAGDNVSLRDVIESDKAIFWEMPLPNALWRELPFLFKVFICAAQPLSIQVHPNKRNSEIGFAKENAAGIPMDAAGAPTIKILITSLSWFCADAFPCDETRFVVFRDCLPAPAKSQVHIRRLLDFLQQPDAERLSELFASLLNMQVKKNPAR